MTYAPASHSIAEDHAANGCGQIGEPVAFDAATRRRIRETLVALEEAVEERRAHLQAS
jgi:hypothetical protein